MWMSHRKLKYSLFQTGLTLLFSPARKNLFSYIPMYCFIILIIIWARNLGVTVDSSLLNLILILKMFLSLFFLLSLDFIPLLHVFCQFLNLVKLWSSFIWPISWPGFPVYLYTIYMEILQKYKFDNNTVALKIHPWLHAAFRKKPKFFSLKCITFKSLHTSHIHLP